MRDVFDRVIGDVLKNEGGFVNNPKDPGGATNMGITLNTLSHWQGRRATVKEVRNLHVNTAVRIYRANYWQPIRGDDLPAGLDYAVFDFAINSGPTRAAEYLQRVLGVKRDGKIGPVTLAAAKRADTVQTINRLMDARLSFMKRIRHRKTGALLWTTFGRGWSARIRDVRAKALSLAGSTIPTAPTAPQPSQPAPVPSTPPTQKDTILGLLGRLISLIIRKFLQ